MSFLAFLAAAIVLAVTPGPRAARERLLKRASGATMVALGAVLALSRREA